MFILEANMLDILNNLAGILTAIIAIVWFFISRRINFFEKGNIIGLYKTFKSLIGRKNKNVVAIIELNIDHISNKGWFTGRIDYSEITRPPGARSEGGFNCIGYIEYNLFTNFVHVLKRSTSNPLDYDRSKAYKGKLYIISRNDFSLDRSWKDFLIESYDLKLFSNTFRIEISNKVCHSEVKTQLRDPLLLVNTNYVKDQLYDVGIKTEFQSYPPLED